MPGFTVRDVSGSVFYLKFDGKDGPKLATSAEVISTRILHAAGYNVPQNVAAHVQFETMEIGGEANTLNMYIRERDSRGYVKHYLIDQGASLRSSTTAPRSPKSENEYMVDLGEVGRSLLGGGLYRRVSETALPMEHLEIGYLESEVFNPGSWVTNYPNVAFEHCTNRDGYWFARSNPIDRFRIAGENLLFSDLAVDGGLEAALTRSYRCQFYDIDGNGPRVNKGVITDMPTIPIPEDLTMGVLYACQVRTRQAD